MSFATHAALLLQIGILDTILQHEGPAGLLILACLIVLSVYSWTVIFSKLGALRNARRTNARFLRAFRKAANVEAVVVASEQFRPSPLVTVFDFGYEELERQVKTHGKIANRTAVERALQLGVSEELMRLENRMNVLATAASVSPFVGLLGTVMGIIRAFEALVRRVLPACARWGRESRRRSMPRRWGFSPQFPRPWRTTPSAIAFAKSARAWTISRSNF